ncbi:SDR family oxidoreductase [Janibacter alittae]|uniref:SDR family oxidoreductase n=1 Tax=Janibacter alittae TaxID=3115209 RepID=A0ABZ2MD24_9MICO
MRIVVAGGTGVIGCHVVAAARDRGHETVVLTRSTGTDLYAGTGLDERLTGAEAVIDATSVQTVSARTSVDFFRTVTQHLVTAGRRCGVRHHVVVSIIGAQEAPFSYYAGKQAQEHLVLDQPSGTVVRAGQFHEFVRQTMARTKAGPIYAIPRMRSQPVAASEVAGLLVDVAEQDPQGLGPEIAGPQELTVADMARRVIEHEGGHARVIEVPFPGGFGRAMRDGTLVARAGTRLGRLTFDEWLADQRGWRGR